MTAPNLPVGPDKLNDERAARAKHGLESYAVNTGLSWDDVLTDMICNLLHLSDREPCCDFERALDRARHHYAAETVGDLAPE